MNAIDPALVDDVRALLAAFVSGDARTFQARLRDGVDLSIARDGAAISEVAVAAPHVATLVSLRSAGATVGAGEVVAVISVLDARQEIAAPAAGVVLRPREPGDLVEFGQPILWIAQDGP